MKSRGRVLDRSAAPPHAPGFEGQFLRLVKGGAERRAIEAGQVDAVMDRETGKAFLLPAAQAALQTRVRSLLALSADWCWEQDEFYRFVSHTGAASGSFGIYDESILGKTLRDAPFGTMSEPDWQAHRTLLDWRATFRDLELGCTDPDRAGGMRWVSVSGEPTFDEQDQFRGYRGTMRDITLRKHAEALAQKPIRLGFDTLDALAFHVCVLDSAGTVILANKASPAFAAGSRGIGAGVPEGANYLDVYDKAHGDKRVDGVAIAAGIRQVIAGDRPLFRHEYVCSSPPGRCRFSLIVTAFPGQGLARAVVSHEPIAEPGRGEQPPGLEHNVAPAGPIANRLLAALPGEDYQNMLAGLEPVKLTYGEVLYQPGEPIRHVYFPQDGLVSLLATAEGHEALEVGLVGREGVIGNSLAAGIDVSTVRALVQGTGTALRMDTARFREEFRKSLPLQGELHRFTHAMLAQARQTATCNRFHVVEKRLARWLLMTRDRMESTDFFLTQAFLADMLGVRRERVTGAASSLQRRNLITYSRGKIQILDGAGLEAASCVCYEMIKDGCG